MVAISKKEAEIADSITETDKQLAEVNAGTVKWEMAVLGGESSTRPTGL